MSESKSDLPDEIFGINAKEAYDKVMNAPDKKPEEKLEDKIEKPKPIPINPIFNPGDYIFLPGHNIYVAKEVTLKGTNWYEAHKEAQKQNARMITLPEFIEFLKLLKSGTAKDGLGNKLSVGESTKIDLEILEKRNPHRGEWLDAKFEEINGVLYMNFIHLFNVSTRGKLLPLNKTPLKLDYIMKDCNIDINSFNIQGLPTREGDDLHYWCPETGFVAAFGADIDMAFLNCGRDPEFGKPEFGIRLGFVYGLHRSSP